MSLAVLTLRVAICQMLQHMSRISLAVCSSARIPQAAKQSHGLTVLHKVPATTSLPSVEQVRKAVSTALTSSLLVQGLVWRPVVRRSRHRLPVPVLHLVRRAPLVRRALAWQPAPVPPALVRRALVQRAPA